MKDTKATALSMMLLLNRITLGVYFALSGVRKLLPNEETGVIDRWKGFAASVAAEAPLPDLLGKAYGYALPPVETLAGLALVIGFYTRVSALTISLMLLSFVIAKGVMWWPANGSAFNTNIILLTLAMLIMAAGSGKFALKPDSLLK